MVARNSGDRQYVLRANDSEAVDSLLCDANCNPTCNYTWSKTGGVTETAATNHTQYLLLGAVSKGSAGVYICTVLSENGHIGTLELVVDIVCK